MRLEDFPLLRSAARSAARLDQALTVIMTGVADGAIRNVALQEAKSTLSRAVEAAWGRYVNEPHFFGKMGRGSTMRAELNELYYSVNVYGLHEVHAAAKRVAATKVVGPEVDAMRTLLQELLPLAQAVSGLKDKIVKGRVVAPPRPPANPDQLRLTCGCCFRPIAVTGGEPTGYMAHHGYRRPGHGWQTASCPGIKFMPLETTDDGPRYMLGVMARQLERAQAALAACPNLKSLPILVREHHVKSMKEITPGMPQWRQVYAAHVRDLEQEIRGLTMHMAEMRQLIRDWRPLTDAAKALLIARHGEIPAALLAPADGPEGEASPAHADELDEADGSEEEPQGERMTG